VPVASAPTPPLAADLARLLGGIRRSLNQSVRAATGAAPLPDAQVEVLRLVERRPGLSVQAAAAELCLASNTVSTLVHRLVDAGLLEREADAADGRVARLTLTRAALSRLRLWRDRRQEILAAHLAALSESERAGLARALPVLERLAASLAAGGRAGEHPAGEGSRGAR
jgi:DNA-binding MarR family transcriptional regulator